MTEPVYGKDALRFFYDHPIGRILCRPLLEGPAFSRWYGRRMASPRSRGRIPGFIARYGLDPTESERPPGEYPSFDAFFSRRLREGARPFDPDPAVLPSPADGKILVFPELAAGTGLPVKGAHPSIAALLASADDAARFVGGSALVLRLAVQDPHRFAFPDDGEAGAARVVPGTYHSVGAIARTKVPDVVVRNARSVTLLSTRGFGQVAYVEVGALTVASIVQTGGPGAVRRGQEKGYFRFGGSTLVLLFEPGAVAFDDDLVRDSAGGLEVQVRAGERIARACGTMAT